MATLSFDDADIRRPSAKKSNRKNLFLHVHMLRVFSIALSGFKCFRIALISVLQGLPAYVIVAKPSATSVTNI